MEFLRLGSRQRQGNICWGGAFERISNYTPGVEPSNLAKALSTLKFIAYRILDTTSILWVRSTGLRQVRAGRWDGRC